MDFAFLRFSSNREALFSNDENVRDEAQIPMNGSKGDYTEEEIEQRMRETVRRSFQIPHKMQKEMVGKVGRPSRRRSKAVEKPQQKP
jgi:hypothetical protein